MIIYEELKEAPVPATALGLAPIRDEVEYLRTQATDIVAQRTEAFFAELPEERDDDLLARWFIPRCWRELDYVFLIGEQLRRYGVTFQRKHVVALSKHLYQEADHYHQVASIVEELGGEVPVEPPQATLEWSEFLWASLDEHRLAGIAAWWTSETAAAGTFDGIFEASKRYALPSVAKTYEQIVKDEKFHVGLGDALLNQYIETEADAQIVLEAVRGMARIVEGSHTSPSD